MQININTDKNIDGNERLVNYYTELLETQLSRFEDHITSISVHFGDENSEKFSKDDKRCVIEARVQKLQPIVVTDHADSVEKAFSNASHKLKKVLETTFDKIKSH